MLGHKHEYENLVDHPRTHAALCHRKDRPLTSSPSGLSSRRAPLLDPGSRIPWSLEKEKLSCEQFLLQENLETFLVLLQGLTSELRWSLLLAGSEILPRPWAGKGSPEAAAKELFLTPLAGGRIKETTFKGRKLTIGINTKLWEVVRPGLGWYYETLRGGALIRYGQNIQDEERCLALSPKVPLDRNVWRWNLSKTLKGKTKELSRSRKGWLDPWVEGRNSPV